MKYPLIPDTCPKPRYYNGKLWDSSYKNLGQIYGTYWYKKFGGVPYKISSQCVRTRTRTYTGLSKNMLARLRELITMLLASSHNLGYVFWTALYYAHNNSPSHAFANDSNVLSSRNLWSGRLIELLWYFALARALFRYHKYLAISPGMIPTENKFSEMWNVEMGKIIVTADFWRRESAEVEPSQNPKTQKSHRGRIHLDSGTCLSVCGGTAKHPTTLFCPPRSGTRTKSP